MKFIYYYFLLLLLVNIIIYAAKGRQTSPPTMRLNALTADSHLTLRLLPGMSGHPRIAESRDGPVAASSYQLLAGTELISRQKSTRKPNFGTFGPIRIYIESNVANELII